MPAKRNKRLWSYDRRPTALAVFFVCVVAVMCAVEARAQEDEYSLFERAKNAYDRGEYSETVSRFEVILRSDLKNPALILECHKLTAVSFLFLGDPESAERHFDELLTREPDYTLDPMLFPISVIDFFLEIKAKNDEKLEALKLARARDEELKRQEDEKRRLEELEKLKRNVYLERSRKQHSILVAMIPFGAGQFQNDQVGKGVFFLGSELLLATTTVTTYFLHASLRDYAKEPLSNPDSLQTAKRRETAYRVVNQTSAIALGCVAIWGIVDSLFNYVPETINWQPLEEREVPEDLRPGHKTSKRNVLITPYLGESTLGVGVSGRF